MIRQNLHTHSTFDDGQNTMEEMVRAALSNGLTSLGFSIHTPLPYENSRAWTIAPDRMPDFLAEARRLRDAYQGRIAVYCGAEWDLLSDVSLEPFDYVIGSVHHISYNGADYSVDATPIETARCLREAFGGDTDTAAEVYFSKYADLAEIEAVDIVGHFDLLTKFVEIKPSYDADSPRFRTAALAAMDALISAGKIFEINTGAVARGYRTAPYPSQPLLLELNRRGGRITISADAHSAGDMTFGFAEAERLALDCGFTELWQFDGNAFTPIPLDGA